jgi:tripartite-type tricarboxylate transporter receptor subunit TctC
VFTDPPLAKTLAGKIRPLAVSSLNRVAAMPDVAPLAEQGFPGFEAVSWHMIVAPAGTPKPIVDRLHAEIKRIVATPEFKQQTLTMGLDAIDSPPPGALKRYLDEEIQRWGDLVKQVGIQGTQ